MAAPSLCFPESDDFDFDFSEGEASYSILKDVKREIVTGLRLSCPKMPSSPLSRGEDLANERLDSSLFVFSVFPLLLSSSSSSFDSCEFVEFVSVLPPQSFSNDVSKSEFHPRSICSLFLSAVPCSLGFLLLFSDLAIPSAYVSRVVIKDGNTDGGGMAR